MEFQRAFSETSLSSRNFLFEVLFYWTDFSVIVFLWWLTKCCESQKLIKVIWKTTHLSRPLKLGLTKIHISQKPDANGTWCFSVVVDNDGEKKMYKCSQSGSNNLQPFLKIVVESFFDLFRELQETFKMLKSMFPILGMRRLIMLIFLVGIWTNLWIEP